MTFAISVEFLSASPLQNEDASCCMTFWYNLADMLLETPIKDKSLKSFHNHNKEKITKDL